jgi:hypothetical protein
LKRYLPLLPVAALLACTTQAPYMSLPDAIHTLTATMWTPTVTTTPVPNTARLVDVLNANLLGADPLSETVDAKYYVLDLQFVPDEKEDLVTLRVSVECECVYSTCCSDERTFVQLMRALVANQKTVERVCAELPATIRQLQVVAFDQMQQKGSIQVEWADVLLYAGGQINGNQLGSRIVRLGP